MQHLKQIQFMKEKHKDVMIEKIHYKWQRPVSIKY